MILLFRNSVQKFYFIKIPIINSVMTLKAVEYIKLQDSIRTEA